LWDIKFLSDSISVEKLATDVNIRVSAMGIVGAARNISPYFERVMKSVPL